MTFLAALLFLTPCNNEHVVISPLHCTGKTEGTNPFNFIQYLIKAIVTILNTWKEKGRQVACSETLDYLKNPMD